MILLFLSIVAVLELSRRVPLFPAFRDMSNCSMHAMRLVSRRGVSEWRKERAMRILSVPGGHRSRRGGWARLISGAAHAQRGRRCRVAS